MILKNKILFKSINIFICSIIFTSFICENISNKNITINSNNNKNIKKNLIIGLAFGYPWKKIRNFFMSLFEAKFQNCDYVMFVRGLTRNTLKKIKSFGVKIYQMQRVSKIGPNNYRWELYKDFLEENKDKYNLVFTADTRDTIFQKDIFQFYENYTKPFLGINLEDIFLSNQVNKEWLLLFCNETEFNNKLSNKIVICGGTLIGTADKFIELFYAFWDVIKDIKNIEKVFDQGVFNYIFYYKKLFNDSIIIKDNKDFIMTIGATKRNKINLDNNDNILNFNGKIAAVVHQYDRHKDLVEKMDKKYDDKNFNYNFSVDIDKNENNKIKFFIHNNWINKKDIKFKDKCYISFYVASIKYIFNYYWILYKSII